MMRCYTLLREQWVASPLQRTFPFFAEPGNLALITPPSLDFRLLTPPPVHMEKGHIIDYTIRLMGLPVRLRTLITTYQPPRCFVDELMNVPYSFWHHTHRFEPRDGCTPLYDEVRYALPMALIGPARGLAMTLWNYTSCIWATKAWKRWLAWAVRSRLEPVKKVAATIKDHLWGIINAVVLKADNGGAESINSLIKMIKVRSRGFRNKQRFRNAIYFHPRRLDLYPIGIKQQGVPT